MKKIEALSDKQEEALIQFRDHCLLVGRSSEPANKPASEEVFKSFYRQLKKSEPYIWWSDGPAVASLVRTVLSANLRANLWDNLWDNLGANLGANLGDNFEWSFWGQHDLAWQAFYFWPHDALRPMHSKSQMELLTQWIQISQSCGWWQPFDGIVFACERPARQSVDEQGRLHHESLPALLCRDGLPVYAWHGVRVPERVICSPETILWKDVQEESNQEVRRVMIQRLGAEKLLREAGAKQEHSDDFGTLFSVPNSDRKVVKVVNATPEPDGTFKEYFLFVPPQMKRAKEAVAWTFNQTESEYQPSIQT